MRKNVVIVSPHPDDAEIGTGGTVIKLKNLGYKVFLVDLTTGEPTPYGSEKKRKKEAGRSDSFLRIDKRLNLSLENRYLFDSKEARLKLAEKLRIYEPDILFCPYPEDAHPDHVAAAEITEGARFYAKYTKLSLKGKPHYPFYLFYYFCNHLRIIPKISFLVDISDTFSEKMKSIKCYRSQFIDNPKNKFVFDLIQTRDRYLGSLIQSKYAEAFYSKEILKINDFGMLL